MKKYYAFFIFLLLPLLSLYSQQKIDDDEQFDDAEYFFATEDYKEALYLFKQLLVKYPENSNLNFRTGMTYLNIEGYERNSLEYFLKAVKNTTLKYKARDFDVKEAPHHAWFYLGNAYRINNELDKALESYKSFQDIKKFEKKYNLGMVEAEIKACGRAKIIKDNPINLFKDNVGEVINTGGKTYHPIVNSSETAMCFMQEQKFYNAIMYSVMKDDGWGYPMNITPQIGSDGDMIPTSLSADGNELLLVRRTKSSNGNIYYSKKEGNFWSPAIKLGKNINSMSDEDHASFSVDGKHIIFSSARRGSLGELDLYISKRQADESWGKAVNLGPKINSDKDETSAYLLQGDSVLYFASRGHFNMGGYDIFFTKKDKNGEWIDAINIGYPLNTTTDNIFYQPVLDGNTGYLALYGDDLNIGEQDIYRIEILAFSDPVVPENSKFNQDFTILLEGTENGERIELTYDRKTDNFTINSNKKTKYKLTLKKR